MRKWPWITSGFFRYWSVEPVRWAIKENTVEFWIYNLFTYYLFIYLFIIALSISNNLAEGNLVAHMSSLFFLFFNVCCTRMQSDNKNLSLKDNQPNNMPVLCWHLFHRNLTWIFFLNSVREPLNLYKMTAKKENPPKTTSFHLKA